MFLPEIFLVPLRCRGHLYRFFDCRYLKAATLCIKPSFERNYFPNHFWLLKPRHQFFRARKMYFP